MNPRTTAKWFPILAVITLFLTACGRSVPPAPVAAPPRPAIVPADGVLTLATPADVAAAAPFARDPDIQKAVNDFIAKPRPDWNITAARPVGDYVLLWIGFPKFIDGGAHLIYSTKDKRIYWTFLGGYLG